MDNKITPTPLSIVPIVIQETYDTRKVKDVYLYCECGSSEKGIVLGVYNCWALWLTCRVCNRTWYICNRCLDSRKKITNKPALYRHHRKQHYFKNKPVCPKKQIFVTAANKEEAWMRDHFGLERGFDSTMSKTVNASETLPSKHIISE